MGVRIFVMLIFRDPVLFFNTQSIWQFVEVLFTLQFKHWTGLGQSYLAHRYVDGSYYTAHKPCTSPLHRVWRSWNVTCTALQRTMTTAKDKLPRYESVRTAFLFCLIIVTHLKYSWSALKVHAQKNNKNPKGYDTFETTYGKLLERRIQLYCAYFYVTHFWPFSK